MRTTTLTTTLGALALAAPAALAQSNLPGSDSCGLGWQVTQEKTMIATTTRGTTNNVVPYTFGMTSGTLGCDQHSIAAKDMEAARFAVVNMDALRLEIAAGQGERLAALSQVMGCSDAAGFARTLKGSYADVFPHPGVTGVEAFKNIQAAGAGCV